MKVEVKNMMREPAMFVPVCCGATIRSFSPEATTEEIKQGCAKIHGRTVIVVGGKSFPRTVKKLYDGVGLTSVGKCKCNGGCPTDLLPARDIDGNTVVVRYPYSSVHTRYLSKIADNVFIWQSLNNISQEDVAYMLDLLDVGDVLMAVLSQDQVKEKNLLKKSGWGVARTIHHAYYPKRSLYVLFYKK